MWGPDDGRLVVGLPGLTANSRSLAAVAGRLAAQGRRVAALDLRGRGHSEVTAAGTYGWPAHARDAVAAADALGAGMDFDVVGHSMGAFVAMQLVADHPAFAGKVVLVDAVGAAEPAALGPIFASVGRLEQSFATVDELIATVRAGGHVEPWSDMWDTYYRYEATTGDDGSVRSRTSHAAIMEDAGHMAAHPPYELWPHLRVPALLVRATVPLGGPAGGLIVQAADRDRIAAEAPAVQIVEIDANHYGVIAHPAALEAIAEFLA